MKGKKACRKLMVGYLLDFYTEKELMEEAGLNSDGTELNPSIHNYMSLDIPGELECDIIKSTVAVRRCGAAFSVALHTICEGEARPTILVDRFFEQISDRSQRFLLAHEIGHICHGDIGTPEQALASGVGAEGAAITGRSLEREWEADSFATRIVGKREALRAMKEMRRLAAKNKWMEIDIDEINLRIRHLMLSEISAA